MRRLRYGLFSVLLCLPLLAGLVPGAAAQTVVPGDWALKPTGLTLGQQFRLLFVTSSGLPGTYTTINTYNTLVQNAALAGHAAISPYGSQFRAVASTSTVDARDNTSTTGTGVPIYWLNGSKVADNYGDFYDNSWDNEASGDYRNQSGTARTINSASRPWTGTTADGTKALSHHLGNWGVGALVGDPGGPGGPIEGAVVVPKTGSRPLYALSPVFEVGAPRLTFSIHAPSPAAGSEGNAGTTDKTFTFSLSGANTADFGFTLCVSGTATQQDSDTASSGDDYVLRRYDRDRHDVCKGITVGTSTDISRLAAVVRVYGDTVAETDETVTLTISLQENATHVVLGTKSATYTIENDDGTPDPQISITGGSAVTEGGTASYTVSASPAPTANLDVSLSVADAPGANFVASGNEGTGKTVRIPATMSSATYTVATVQDTIDEPSGPVTVTVAPGSGYTVGSPNSAPVTVNDNDATTVTLTTPDTTATEDSSTDPASIVLTLNRGLRSGESLAVPLGFSGGAVGTNFMLALSGSPASVALSGSTVTFTGPSTGATATVATVLLTASADSNTTNETVTVSIPASSSGNAPKLTATGLGGGATGSRVGNGQITLADDDVPATVHTLSVRVSPAAAEGHSGITYRELFFDVTPARTASFHFRVCLSGTAQAYLSTADTTAGLALDYAIHDAESATATVGTGLPPSDGTCPEGRTGVNNDFQSNKRYWIGVKGDTTVEPAETVIVTLQRATGADATPADVVISSTGGSATYTISNDDSAGTPVVTIAGGAAVTEGGNVKFTMNASPATTFSVPVNIAVSDAPDADFLIATEENRETTTLPASFSSGPTLFPTSLDSTDEPSGVVTVRLLPGDGYEVGDPSSASVRVNDDDPTAVTLTTPDKTAREGDASATAELVLTPGRALRAGESLAVPLQFSGGTLNTHFTLALSGNPTGVGLAGSTVTFTGSAGGSAAAATVLLTAATDGNLTDETVTVSIPASSSGTAPKLTATGLGGGATGSRVGSGEITLTDTTVLPVVTVTGGPAVTEGTGASYTVSANPAPTANLDVSLGVADAAGANFVASGNEGTGKTVRIAADAASATYTVPTVADSTDEPSGPVTVTVQNGSGYTVGSQGSAPVTVNDNDATTVTLATPDKTATEGSASDFATLRLDLNRALRAGESLAIPLRFAGGVLNTDFTLALSGSPAGVALSGSTVTFTGSSGGSATRTDIQLSAADDSDADDETVTVSIPASSSGNAPKLTATGLGGGATGSRVGDGRIALSDTTPEITIARGPSPVTEGTDATYTVSADPAPAADLTVNLAVADAVGADFVAPGNQGGQTVTVPTGGSATFTLPTVGDDTDEPSGAVTVTVQGGSGYAVGSPSSAAVTVNDDDAPQVPTLSVSDATGAESARPHPVMRFRIQLSQPSERWVRVTARTRDSSPASARQDRDYFRNLFTVRFRPGETEQHVWIRIRPDAHAEGPETFELVLSEAVGAPIGDGVGVGTITEHPTAGVTVSRTALAVEEGGGAGIYTVGLTGPPPSGESVTVTAAVDDAAVAGVIPLGLRQFRPLHGAAPQGSATLHFTAGNWTETRTLWVVAHDDEDAADAATRIVHTVSGTGAWGAVTAAPVAVTVTDDDTPAVPVVTVTGGATVNEGGNASFTVRAHPAPAAALTVNLAVADAPDANFVDAGDEGAGKTVTLAADTASATYTVATVQALIDEPNGPVTLTVASGDGYTVGEPASAEIMVRDNNPTRVTLTTPDPAAAEGDGADTASIALTLSRGLRSGESLAVPLGLSGGTLNIDFILVLSGSPADVALSGSTVTFTGPDTGASATVATVLLTVLDDVDTDDETVTVSIPAWTSGNAPRLVATGLGGGATGSRTGDGRITLSDDDAAVPVVTVTGGPAVTEGAGASFTVSASPAPAASLDVSLTVADAPGADFVADGNQGAGKTVTIAADTASATYTVATVPDIIDEPSGPVTVTVAPGSGYTVGNPGGSAAVTVNDDDGPPPATPVASFAAPSERVSESAGTRNVRVNFSPAPASALTLGYTVGGTAASGADYTALPGTVAVSPGATGVDIAVAIADDGANEHDETVVLTLTAGTGYTVGSTGVHTLTIADDDTPVVRIAGGAAVSEGAPATFTLSASPAPAAAIAVNVIVSDSGSFAAGGQTGTRQVSVGTGGTGSFTVTTLGDGTDERDGRITAAVVAGAGYAPHADDAADTVAVADDDATTVTLAVPDPTATEGDGADTAAIALTLSRALLFGESLGVPLQFSGGAVGTDFTLALSGSPAGVSLAGSTVTFTGGATPSATAATVRLTASADSDTDDDTVTVSLGTLSPTGLGGGATGSGTGTITLADTGEPLTARLIPFLKETPPGQAGLPEGTTMQFNLTLNRVPAPDEIATVPLALGGDATRGADYRLSCREIAGVTCSNLDRGNPSITFDGSLVTSRYASPLLDLHLVEDNRDESTETVTLNLGDNTHSQGIVDAPDSVVVSFTQNHFAVFEPNGPLQPLMTVTPPAGRDIPLFFTIGGTATEGESGDFYLDSPVLQAGIPRGPFDVRIVGDEVDEPDETVILTLDAARLPSWVTVGDIGTATGTIWDNDPTVVSLTRTGPGAVAEDGGRAGFTVSLGRALVASEVVDVPLEVSGEGVTTADWTLVPTPRAANTGVTLSHETTVTPRLRFAGAGAHTAALELRTVEDGVSEGDETVTVALGPDGGGANGFDRGDLGTNVRNGANPHASANRFDVRVREGAPALPVVSVTAGPAVTEGARATFTVAADTAPASMLAVWLEVGQSGEYLDRRYRDIPGRKFAFIRAGATSATFTVPTANDETNEAHGAVTARVVPRVRYYPADPPHDLATVTVNDDDGGATGPALSVNDVTAREGADHNAVFTVSLSPAPTERVTVPYYTRESTPVSARSGEDYIATRGSLRFGPGETSKTVYVFINEDFHDEPPETFELFLAHARGGAWIADGVGVGTIVNDDPLPAAWLARFGRTVAEQALEGIADRRAAARTPGLRGTLAGQALDARAAADEAGPGAVVPGASALDGAGPLASANSARGFDGRPERSGHRGFDPGFGDAQAPPRTMTMREALLGSRFTLTGEADASGGTAAFWGRAAQGSFDGREGPLALDGDVTTAMLGADYARDRWLVGLALTQSEGEGGWTDTEPDTAACPEGMDARTRTLCEGAVRGGDGTVESSLTAAIPYASLQASERVGLWGALGVGSGRVTLAPETGRSLAADTDWRMAAAGLRGELLTPPESGSGPALALTSDALWARTASDRTRDLAASQSDVTRLRLGLEGSYRFALGGGGPGEASGASLVPRLELGARHDGGDAETGFGIELGGGLAWDDPGLGLSLDLSGRTLLAHEDDALEDRGFAAALAFDPSPETERGPSFSLRQDWGASARGGLDALFTPAPLDERIGAEAASRWTAEAAYGFTAFGGRYTASPHAGLGLATDARDYTLGWRWTPAPGAPDLSFGLEAVRRESDADASEHAVGFEVRARW